MLRRIASTFLRSALRQFPAVTIVGPRQCGKTTLARSLGGSYFDLEQESERVRLDLEWKELIAGKSRLILDEAQSYPEVFPRLRGAIDANRRKNGRFLLLGSVSPVLMRSVSESLAGRMAVAELTPFLRSEIRTTAMRSRLWLMGGFPDGGVRRAKAFPLWQDNYLRLMTERDLPALGIPCTQQTTSRLLRMLAALNGQQFNASELAFLIRRLPAFHTNRGKRLVKAPKLFWRDAGLLHAILGITSMQALRSHPSVGASWESYVVEQALGVLTALGAPHTAYHFRTSDGHELDLVLEIGRERIAVEIKLTSNPSPHDLARLEKCAAMINATRSILVTNVPTDAGDKKRLSCGLDRFLRELQTLGKPTART